MKKQRKQKKKKKKPSKKELFQEFQEFQSEEKQYKAPEPVRKVRPSFCDHPVYIESCRCTPAVGPGRG